MAPVGSKRGSAAKSSKLTKLKTKFFREFNYLRKKYNYKSLLCDPEYMWFIAILLFIAELAVNILVIKKIPYTEIDWKAYMQQVEGVWNGTFDYTKLKGGTGPVVYPAGYIYIFLCLYFITGKGSNILTAQCSFAFLYLITLILVFKIYMKSKKIPPYCLIFMCCTSYRIHSIYILRLFNDPVAMLLLLAAVYCFLSNKWTLGSTFYSFAVSVKMNILLFAPALWFLLLASIGFKKTILNILLCGIIQIALATPFLIVNPVGYISQAFNLGRIFLFEWTVNWRFLPEELFLNRNFHLSLLALHLILLLLFSIQWKRWLQLRSWFPVEFPSHTNQPLMPDQILLPLFTANLIGIACSRSLHYQFYVWYYHTLPYILWSTNLPIVTRLFVLGLIELSWNTYPSTIWSSAILHACHFIILMSLYFRPVRIQIKMKM